MFKRLMLAALVVAAGVPVFARQGSGPTAQQVAASIQKRYDSTRDFSADFVHNYEGGLLKKKVTERGRVQVKKPGRMRWDYIAPEKKEFVSDGSRIYLYIPSDKQVMVSPVPKQDQATTAVLFLTGKGNLTRDFTVSFTGSRATDTYALKLQPKLPERDYDWLEVVVDRSSYQIRALTAADKQGGRSTFQFSNFKENPGLSDKIFAFKIPRGADVINTDAPSRR